MIVLGVVLLAIGGLPFLMWGIFMRTVVGLHATWLVNSATHSWGTRRFATRDLSTNSWWVAVLTFGEGWHNNHQAREARRSGARTGANAEWSPDYAGHAGRLGRRRLNANRLTLCCLGPFKNPPFRWVFCRSGRLLSKSPLSNSPQLQEWPSRAQRSLRCSRYRLAGSTGASGD